MEDPAIGRWFLDDAERGNPSAGMRTFSTGNHVEPLVDGAHYFARLCQELAATAAGDQVYLLDFRGDLQERLGGPGTEIGAMLGEAVDRGVLVYELLWRSHPRAFQQSEEENAAFVRYVCEHGGDVLLDARTRRGGSHHQKLVVIRHPDAPERDVAFVGGIDLGFSRHDDNAHRGDEQTMDFPAAYGRRPPWHDLQAEVRGPAVHDLEHTFRERWYGSSALDVPSPMRQLYDRAYHASAMTGRPLPEPVPDDPTQRGTCAVQVLRTYPARLRRYPFAPLGERSVAHSYRKVLRNARRLVYVEDQYLWSRDVAQVFAEALRASPDLHFVAVLPRFSDREGWAAAPTQLGRDEAVEVLRRAGGDRVHLFDVENHAGEPVYVHAKAVIVDDVWAVIGSDNLNRRSWTHDSELSIAVLDEARDDREPRRLGVDDVRRFARDLRLRLAAEHLDLDDPAGVVDPDDWLRELDARAAALRDWHAAGRTGPRPPGRLQPHVVTQVPRSQRLWSVPLYRLLFDPDGRAWRDRVRRRP